MVRRARHTPARIDRDYPHQVEIEVPEGGLGERLNAMHQWCLKNAPDYMTRSADAFPRQAVRFCFGNAAVAEAFRSVMLDKCDD